MTRGRSAAVAIALAALLAGCSMFGGRKAVDEAPTIASLAGRTVAVDADQGIGSSAEQAIAAYRDFLRAAPQEAQVAEAMRRLGDLEMDRIDGRLAAGGAADYRGAIAQYLETLRRHPDQAGNDRVLYQLARAYELAGELPPALATLDRLVQRHPRTSYADEAHFRRGELLFAMGRYGDAEQAFATVLQRQRPTPFHERSLYMRGWTQFKQSRLEEALQSFFGLLDLKLAEADAGGELETAGLARADRELVDDTLRVVSLSLQNLQGADSIAPFTDTQARRRYEVRVYEALGETYVRQQRIKDAADTFAAFARRHPLHPRAPLLQARVIDIYQHNGFATLALAAKREYVEHYGLASELKRTHEHAWRRAQPLVRTHLAELARHHHGAAQKGRQADDVEQAVRWYRQLLASFPGDAQAAEANFLLAELLFENRRFAEAAAEYEQAAYGEAGHPRRADAGYAALLAHAEVQKGGGAPAAEASRAAIASALRFAESFGTDARAPAVLVSAAEALYRLGDADRAASVAQQVLQWQPPAADSERRTASWVIANSAFDAGAFDRAEAGYRDVLALTGAQDKRRAEIAERIAASIYKQGEQARGENRLRDAVGHFERVAAAAPSSDIAAAAQVDAAAALIALQDWDRAAAALVDFRSSRPNHPLARDAGEQLALVYLEQQRWGPAAAEFERIAATSTDAAKARAALWQAAELHEKAGAAASAAHAFENYLKRYPQPLEPALQSRYRLALLARAGGDRKRGLELMRQVRDLDLAAGGARSDRTRYLGAMATLALAEPAREAFGQVALVEPLQRQLKLKKARLDEVLKAYARASETGVAEAVTAATYHTAELYVEFGRALLASQRPKGLKPQEREQYDVLLEEQAYPFEEKAIELHEANARRAAAGVYDRWVKSSYAALAKLRPVQFGKNELSEGVIDAIR
jgi:TolA-binding protein